MLASKPLRILMVASKDLDGGAHRSAFRLHHSLRLAGVESTMVVREKTSRDPHVHQLSVAEMGWPPKGRGFLDRVPSCLLVKRDEPISLGLQTCRLSAIVERLDPHVVHLHWVNGGMVGIAAAAGLTQPIVWTLHDMWTFTGGCHYAGGCLEYRATCSGCPKVKSWPIAREIPRWVHARKMNLWGERSLNAVAPSLWMSAAGRDSTLFANGDVRHIPYCIDPGVFCPSIRDAARQRLGIPAEQRCVLFVNASQPRKGAGIIGQIIHQVSRLPAWRDSHFFFAGGLPNGVAEGADHIRLLPPTHDEATMAGYFAAADLFVMPSFEDNLPNAIIESLSCGTPVAAFAVGGIPEMITDGQNGCLSTECTVAGMVTAISRLDRERLSPRNVIAANASTAYSQSRISQQHIAFYNDILMRHTTHQRQS